MKISKTQILDQLKERDGLICGICHLSIKSEWNKYQQWKTMTPKPYKRNATRLTIDHIIPKSVIRKNPEFIYHQGWWWEDLDNLQLAHFTCNIQKGNKVIPISP